MQQRRRGAETAGQKDLPGLRGQRPGASSSDRFTTSSPRWRRRLEEEIKSGEHQVTVANFQVCSIFGFTGSRCDDLRCQQGSDLF